MRHKLFGGDTYVSGNRVFSAENYVNKRMEGK